MKSVAGFAAAAIILAVCVAVWPAWSRAVGTADWRVKTEQAKAMFMEGGFEAARDLLQEVVAVQPDNREALHYLGLCYLKLGDPGRALEALGRAADLPPPDAELSQDASWAAIAAGEFGPALRFADMSLAQAPDNEAALLFKAQALIGLRRCEGARQVLEPMLDSSEYGQAAHYYLGTSYICRGLTEQAAPYFERAAALDPGSELGREAALYAAGLAGAAPDGPGDTKTYWARVRLLYQYDTNVVPIFDEDYLPPNVLRKEDGRLMADMDLRFDLYRSGDFRLTPRIYAYQSIQDVERRYDLRFLMAGLQGTYRLRDVLGAGPGRAGLGLYYSNAYLHENFYSESGRLSSELVVPFGGPGVSLMLSADVIYENYATPFDPEFDQDAWRYNVSVSLNRSLLDGRVNAWLGYRWGMARAAGKFYNRYDNVGVAGLTALLPGDVRVTAMYNYELRDYPDSFFDRIERRSTASLTLAIPVYENYDLYLGALHTNVDANVEVMTYQRLIYSAGVQVNLPGR